MYKRQLLNLENEDELVYLTICFMASIRRMKGTPYKKDGYKRHLNYMNGLEGEEDNTCGLNDMNCVEEEEDKTCGLNDMNCLGAVSYTHLDVYKRQPLCGLRSSSS